MVLHQKVYSQISEIKDLASGAADLFSGCSASDVSAGCNCMSSCWEGGFVIIDYLADHHREILNMRNLDPCLMSLDIEMNIAYSVHYEYGIKHYYTYINYLPHLRGNIGIFSTDFRFNILTEYADIPDSYRSWELLFLLNLVPASGFKISLGTGLDYEVFTGKYYNEHYLNFQFGVFQIRDYIDLETRIAVDYSTSLLPFIEAGIKYKTRIIHFDHLYAYIAFGGIYQNYYQAHEIWGASASLAFNIH